MSALAATPLAQSGPVIPNFGRGDECIRNNGKFCLHWFVDNFNSRFLPRVGEHIKMTLIAIVIGFVIAFAAALLAHRHSRLELPFANVASLLRLRCTRRGAGVNGGGGVIRKDEGWRMKDEGGGEDKG